MNFQRINHFIVFLIVLIFYGYFSKQGDWNINSRLGLVKAVVEEGRLTIDSYHAGEFETEDKALVEGHYYSDKAIGAGILGIIAYWPIHQIYGTISSYALFVMLMTILAISIPSALLAPIIYKMGLEFTQERWLALAIALSICLGTGILPYAGAFYGHALSALMAFSEFYIVMEANHFGKKLTFPRSFFIGLLVSFLVLTEYPTALIAVILIVYALYVAWRHNTLWNWKFIVSFALGGSIPLALLLFYNAVSFGSPFTTGYSFNSFEKFQDAFAKGFMGFELPRLTTLFFMTIHPAQGIFIQSPILLLAIGGMYFTARKKVLRAEFITALAIILVFLTAFSGVRLWWGGDSFPSRYLIPILPFFAFFLMQIPRKYHPLLLGIGILSIGQMLIASAVPFNGLDLATEKIVNGGIKFSWQDFLLYTILFPRLLKNKLTTSWGKLFLGVESWYFNIAIPILIALGLLGIYYWINRKAKLTPKIPTSTDLLP